MEEQRDQNKKKMSVTPNSSPPNNGEVRDNHQNSLSSSSAQTLNYDRHPPPRPFTEPNHLQNPHPPPSNPQPPGPSPYRECLKNHAAAIGGHVVDGCGEFMPAGEDGTLESLKCAACDCHRNFHRRVLIEHPNSSAVYYGAGGGGFHHPPVSYYSNAGRNNHIVTTTTHSQPMPPPPLSLIPDHRQSRPGPAIPVMMAFGGCNNDNGGGAADSASSEEDLSNSGGRGAIGLGFDRVNYYNNCTEAEGSSGKKRFRTKFTVQQKDKMAEFAEKLGWKISKQDEQDLARFCAEMGIKRQVFKVWMHNSKQALKKKKNHSFPDQH